MMGKSFETVLCLLSIGVLQLAVPNLAEEAPGSFEHENDDYYGGHIIHYDDSDSATQSSSATAIIVIVGFMFLVILAVCALCCRRPNANHLQENCNVPPPATTNTSRTNVVAQQREEPRRFVIIEVTRDEDHIRHQNRPTDGETPLLSEENILLNLYDSRAAQQPPPYEVQATAEPHLPKYEGLDNAAMEQPPSPAYSDVQATSQSFMNSSQITPSPNVQPPPYEETLISIT